MSDTLTLPDALPPKDAAALAQAVSALNALHLPITFNLFAAQLLLEIIQASDHYVRGHFEGQGLGYAMGLHTAQEISEEQCTALRQVFKDTAERAGVDLGGAK